MTCKRSIIISLNNGITIIDAEDEPLLEGYNWYRMPTAYIGAMTVSGDGKREIILLHRHLMNAPMEDAHRFCIDHINGKQWDNRRENLRIVSQMLNQVNRKYLNKNNSSGIRGVKQYGVKWRARMRVRNKDISLGRFETKEEAIEARRRAEIVYWGENCPVPGEAAE